MFFSIETRGVGLTQDAHALCDRSDVGYSFKTFSSCS